MDTRGWDLLDCDDKDRILKGLAAGRVFGPPRLLDLEWSRRLMLPGSARGRRTGIGADEMDLYTLERLFGEMEDAGVKGLLLGGEGDPLEHRSIESILKRLARVPFPLCSLATGGFSLRGRTAELLARVLRGRLEVRLEADTADACSGRLGVPGSRFRAVIENLRAWKTLRHPAARCGMVVRFVLTPDNCIRIRQMVDAAAAIGADGVVFTVSRGEGDAPAFFVRREEFLVSARAALEADTEGRIEFLEAPHPMMAEDLSSLRAAFPGRYPEAGLPGAAGTLFHTACVMPWLGPAVSPNGAAHSCRRAVECGEPPVGNIHARPLERLWRDRPLRSLRTGAGLDRRAGVACPGCRDETGPPLPYAMDRSFCQELDSLLRGGRERTVRFPERLRDREWSTVVLPLRRLWPWGGDASPEVRVDGVPVGAAAGGDGGVAIRFLPDGLPRGFHLLEVVDRNGRLLKARVVEKVT